MKKLFFKHPFHKFVTIHSYVSGNITQIPCQLNIFHYWARSRYNGTRSSAYNLEKPDLALAVPKCPCNGICFNCALELLYTGALETPFANYIHLLELYLKFAK